MPVSLAGMIAVWYKALVAAMSNVYWQAKEA